MIDPMRQKLDSYHAQAIQNLVPRFRAATIASVAADGASSVDVAVPGAADVLAGVGVCPNAGDPGSFAVGWPVMTLEGGSKPEIIASSPWQVGGSAT